MYTRKLKNNVSAQYTTRFFPSQFFYNAPLHTGRDWTRTWAYRPSRKDFLHKTEIPSVFISININYNGRSSILDFFTILLHIHCGTVFSISFSFLFSIFILFFVPIFIFCPIFFSLQKIKKKLQKIIILFFIIWHYIVKLSFMTIYSQIVICDNILSNCHLWQYADISRSIL